MVEGVEDQTFGHLPTCEVRLVLLVELLLDRVEVRQELVVGREVRESCEVLAQLEPSVQALQLEGAPPVQHPLPHGVLPLHIQDVIWIGEEPHCQEAVERSEATLPTPEDRGFFQSREAL